MPLPFFDRKTILKKLCSCARVKATGLFCYFTVLPSHCYCLCRFVLTIFRASRRSSHTIPLSWQTTSLLYPVGRRVHPLPSPLHVFRRSDPPRRCSVPVRRLHISGLRPGQSKSEGERSVAIGRVTCKSSMGVRSSPSFLHDRDTLDYASGVSSGDGNVVLFCFRPRYSGTICGGFR